MKTKSNLPLQAGSYFALIDREPVMIVVEEAHAEVIYFDGSKDILDDHVAELVEVWIPVESIIQEDSTLTDLPQATRRAMKYCEHYRILEDDPRYAGFINAYSVGYDSGKRGLQ